MNVLYDKNGVLIALSPTILRFGNYQLPTTSSNRGGDVILRDKGFHNVYVKSEGIFSSSYHIVMSYYYPNGAPDEIIWTTKDSHEADEIVAAIKQVLGLGLTQAA